MSKPMSPVAKAAIAGGVIGGVAAALYFIFGKSDSAKDESSTAPAPGGEAGGGSEGSGGTTTTPGGGGGGGGSGGGGWGSTSNWGPWANAASFGSGVKSIWVHAPSEVIQGMAIAMPYYTDASLTASEEPYDDETIKRFSELGRFIQEHGASQVITDADVAVLWLSYDEVANWYAVPASKKLEQLSAIRQALPHGTKLMLVLQVPDEYRRWEFDMDTQIGDGAGDWDLMYIANDHNDRDAGERFIAIMYAPDAESRRRATLNPWTPPAEEKKKPWYWPF